METEEHDRGARRVGVLLALAAVASVAASLAVGARLPSGLRMVWWHPEILVALAWTPVGAVLLRHRPGLKVAWLMVGSGFSASVYVLALNLGPWFELHGWPATGFVQWLATWLWAVDTYALTLILPLIFPDGRLVSRWFRPVLVLACLVPVIVCVHLTIDPDVRRWHNGVSVYPFDRIPLAISAIILLSLAAGLFSIAVRFVQSPPDVRRQIGWVVYPGLVAEAIIFAGENSPIGDPLRNITIVAVPICIAIAITRYRLYDIDLVVSRTLVYAGLVVVITGVYFALVGTASLLAHGRGTLAGLARRHRRGRGVRARPAATAAHGGRVHPRRARPVPDRRPAQPAAADRRGPGRRARRRGRGGALGPARDRGRDRGAGPRRPDHLRGGRRPRRTAAADPAGVARRAGGAAAVRRHPHPRRAAVRRPRPQPRGAGERGAARRRRPAVPRAHPAHPGGGAPPLRRDLHDGLGPTLASLAMTVDAARITLQTDPEAADELLEELRATMGRTIGDIRELVYGLRPPHWTTSAWKARSRRSAASSPPATARRWTCTSRAT